MIKQTTQVICDRCNKEIDGSKYYTISINDHAIINRDDSVYEARSQLLGYCEPAICILPQPEKHFCADCIREIREFIFCV